MTGPDIPNDAHRAIRRAAEVWYIHSSRSLLTGADVRTLQHSCLMIPKVRAGALVGQLRCPGPPSVRQRDEISHRPAARKRSNACSNA